MSPSRAPSARPARPGPWHGRTVVLLGIVLVALNLRIAIASVSPILDLVRGDVAISAAQAGLLGSVPVISFAAFGAVAPLVARRLGLEGTVIAAMLLSAMGEVVRSTTATAAGFLGWSVIALAGMGMGNVLLPPIVKRYFPDRIGAVTAVYSVGMAVSTAVPPLLTLPLSERLGWRVSLASWAAIGVVAVVPWVVVLARAAGTRRAAVRDEPGLAGPRRTGGRVWRSPLAWGLAVTFGINTLNVYVLFAWLPQILADAGHDPATGGRWLALFAVLGLPSALLVPLLAVRVRNPWGLMVFFVACFLGGYLGLLLSPASGLVFWMVLLGIAPGGFPLLLTLVNLRTRTSAGAASLSGFTQGTGYGLAAAGPFVVGVLYDATGGWQAPIGVLMSSVVVLLAVSWVACRPVMLEDTWARTPAARRERRDQAEAGLDTLTP